MGNPGRRDGDGACTGSIDPTVPQAGSDGGPADDLVGLRASDAPRTTEPRSADQASPTGNDDVGGEPAGDLGNDLDGDPVDDLDAGPVDMDDQLLFDPLLSDEPIDLAAVRADDALIDALSGGHLAGADDLADDDPLIAMLTAWAASARPEPAAAAHPTDPDVAVIDPAPHRRPITAATTDEAVGVDAAGGHPDVRTSNTASPDGEASDDGAPGTGSAEQDEEVGVTDTRPDLDPPTVRLIGPRRPTAEDRPAKPETVRPSLAERPDADHGPLGEPGDGPGGAPRSAATATAAVVTLLSRVRTGGRRTRPPGQALPPGHPLRRAAVAVVIAALGVSGAAASGGTAQPGDPAWAITKVFFAKRARSIEAAQVVSAGLERAQIAISRRQPELAKQELAAISVSLSSVGEDEGHTRLVHQQQMLEAVAAVTPPLPGDPGLTATATPSRKPDPDRSVLAQGAPPAAGKDKAAPPAVPPVVTKPGDAPSGSTGATTGGTTGGTGTTDAGTTGSGTTGSDTTNRDTTNRDTTSKTSTETGSTGRTGATTTGTGTGGSETGAGSAVGPTGTGSGGNDTPLAESATRPAAGDTAPADTAPAANDGAPAGADTGAVNDTTLAEAHTGAQPAVPAPAPSPDARGAGTSETTTPGTTTPGTSASGSPVSTTTSAAGSAPAVPADDAGPGGTGGPVVADPVRTLVQTGVVPEPVNVATPTTTATETTTKTSDKPTPDAAANRASSAETPTHTTSAADTAEPVRVTADDSHGSGSSHSESGSGSNSGSGGGSGSGDGSNKDNRGSNNDNSGSGTSGTGNSGSDAGAPGGARVSAAVSIHP